jgi:phospholipase C
LHASAAFADRERPEDRFLQRAALKAKIEHIVYIVKENRTFDHYFGRYPGADGATKGKISTGETVKLRRAPDRMPAT